MNKLRIVAAILLLTVLVGAIGVVSAQDDTTLNILYWQAVSTLNPYLSQGTKDFDASSLVLESLAEYDQDAVLIPTLATEIPTVENGGVSEDLTTITWHLKEGILWSDGTPFTADDVIFTWEYCADPAASCAVTNLQGIASVEAPDPLTVVITYDGPRPFPYAAFVGQESAVLQRAQFADCVGEAAITCTDQNSMPIGTGPYMVSEFLPNDVVTFAANPNYRGQSEGKPFFQTVIFKGGGDAEAAARAVLETGEADYAWNLQVTPQILSSMEAAGLGTVLVAYGTSVERIMVNQTNPDPALGDMRSEWVADGSNAHPFLTIPAVWQAMSMAIDRNVIAAQVYGPAGTATCNVLPAPPLYASTNNDACLVQDMDGAKALLDEAGIVDSDGDGIREANGVPLRVLYQTSTNAVRQATQALVKQWWDELGIETELRNVDAGVYFGADVASPDTIGKFYADLEMYTNNFAGTDPQNYMSQWTCAEIAGSANNWLSNNHSRFCSADYDALTAEMAQTADLNERGRIAIAQNDLIVQGGAAIPLIHRGDVSAVSNRIAGVLMNTWDSEEWNIEDWTLAE